MVRKYLFFAVVSLVMMATVSCEKEAPAAKTSDPGKNAEIKAMTDAIAAVNSTLSSIDFVSAAKLAEELSTASVADDKVATEAVIKGTKDSKGNDEKESFHLNKAVAEIIFDLIPDDPQSDTSTFSLSLQNAAISKLNGFKVEWEKQNTDKDYKEFLIGRRASYVDSTKYVTENDDVLIVTVKAFNEKTFSDKKAGKNREFELSVSRNDTLKFAISCGKGSAKIPGKKKLEDILSGSVAFDDVTISTDVTVNDNTTIDLLVTDATQGKLNNPVAKVNAVLEREKHYYSEDVTTMNAEIWLLNRTAGFNISTIDLEETLRLLMITLNAKEEGLEEDECNELTENWDNNCSTKVYLYGNKVGKLFIGTVEDEEAEDDETGRFKPGLYVEFTAYEMDPISIDEFLDENVFEKIVK